MKKVRIYFVIILWIIFIPLIYIFSIFGNVIEGLFTYFNNDICLILFTILFLIISIVVLFKPNKKD